MNDVQIVRQKFWQKDFRPWPLWDVKVNGAPWAGGFFTKRGARKWIADNYNYLFNS